MHHLHYGKSKKPLACVKPDDRYPTMWRIHWPDGEVSDMVNLARAKDAAVVICRRKYPKLPHDGRLHWKQDSGQSRSEARHSDFGGVPATPVATIPKTEPTAASNPDYSDGYWGV
jgi:hypothetical protein